MATTYEKIATTTLGSAAADITFSSISSAYTDLRLVIVCTTASSSNMCLQFNGDTGTNYSSTFLSGNGTSAASSRLTSWDSVILDTSPNTSTTVPELFTADIFSYAGGTNKTVLGTMSADRNGSGGVNGSVNLWRNTSAITSIKVYAAGVNLSTGTTATLYGILKA
jgi:hypothetical protein